MNGRSAAVCWSCETDLATVGPEESAGDLGSAAEGVAGPVRPAPHGSGQGHGPQATARGDYPELISALEELAVPMAAADAREFADSGPVFPGLSMAADGNDLNAAPPVSAAIPHAWKIATAIILLLLLVAGAFVDFRALFGDGLEEFLAPGSAVSRGGGGGIARPDARPSVDPTQTVPANSPRGVAEALDAAARALAVPPSDSVEATGRPTVASTNQQGGVVAARPKAARPVVPAAPLTDLPSGSGRVTTRSADAAAAVPAPKLGRPEITRQLPVPSGPCTPAVEALGLCATPQIQPKE